MIPTYVDAYSGYRSNERPEQFSEIHELAKVEDGWYEPDAEYFNVVTTNGKTYLLRYEQQSAVWTLQNGFGAGWYNLKTVMITAL